jgi:phosphoenolpyruvate phosphomutase
VIDIDSLRTLLARPGPILVGGASDAVSALLVQRNDYDAVWASGLGISTAHGMPDAGVLTMSEFLSAVRVINRACHLPVIADCDSGYGDVNVFVRMVREYEQAGVAALCIEDKEMPKRNSFRSGSVLADMDEFAVKIVVASEARRTPDLVIIARLESLVVGAGLEDALERGVAYCDAGADAVLVHSKASTADEVLTFARAWGDAGRIEPLFVIPSTFTGSHIETLTSHGIKGIIFANQALRAAIRAMDRVLAAIRRDGCSQASEATIASLEEVFALVGSDAVDSLDRWFQSAVVARRKQAGRKPKRASLRVLIRNEI